LNCPGISKNFGSIQALNEVNLKIDSGEVPGLMGDNGAEKSTMIKIMAGNFPPSSGEIWLKGEKVEFTGPLERVRKASRLSIRTWLFVTILLQQKTCFWAVKPRINLAHSSSFTTNDDL
jgi:simple sugar transport system ATP-binding protein